MFLAHTTVFLCTLLQLQQATHEASVQLQDQEARDRQFPELMDRLPAMTFNRPDLYDKRYGLRSVARGMDEQEPLKSQLVAFKEFCTATVQLNRARRQISLRSYCNVQQIVFQLLGFLYQHFHVSALDGGLLCSSAKWWCWLVAMRALLVIAQQTPPTLCSRRPLPMQLRDAESLNLSSVFNCYYGTLSYISFLVQKNVEGSVHKQTCNAGKPCPCAPPL